MSKYHFQLNETNHADPKTVVIIGAPRGGTSMVAGTVRELGINLGQRLGENHEDPKFLKKDLDHIRDAIALRNEQNETWGWKMPHSTEYIDEIEEDLRNPHVIMVWRNTLATSISQVNRSGSDIHTALQFSTNRVQDMVDKVAKLSCPVLLVDYDRATVYKEDFIDALAEFVGAEMNDEMRQNCLRFIDPSVGYQQVSATYFDVEDVKDEDYPTKYETRFRLRQMEAQDDGGYKVTGPHPAMIFKTNPKSSLKNDFVVRFENRSKEPTRVRILFDYEWEFSQNLAHKVVLEPGVYAFRVRNNGQMKRCAVLPPFEDEQSDLFNIELREVTS